MTFEEHASNLGKLITNLQGLELMLRQFLCTAKNETIAMPPIGQTNVPENHLTNYDTLGMLIEKYNNEVSEEFPNFTVDASVVELRDALAHGRLFPESKPPKLPQRIVKFNRPKNGIAEIVFDAVMDQTWFDEWQSRLNEQIDKIGNCLCEHESLGFGGI